jgi:hypothetical protein
LSVNNIKVRLKGHESFHIREGWLRKGMKGIQNDSTIFAHEEASDILGVGSNMVKSIRFWLQACGLTIEKHQKNGKRYQVATDDFGSVIMEYDPYFEDVFTYWLIHYKIASNFEFTTSWYIFFNELNVSTFTKVELMEAMQGLLVKYVKDNNYSESSLNDDCNCILKTYYIDEKEYKNPEDNLTCPVTMLDLIKKIKYQNGKQVFIKNKPKFESLDRLIVLYIILDNLKGKDSVSIDAVLNDKCNVGKILNLDRVQLNDYLDVLKKEKLININRTAGLDIIYVNNITTLDVLNKYYKDI